MTEKVAIANMALTMLGEAEITSLDDESARARIMKTHYIPARDATLEAHEWSFAIKRFIPAQTATPPEYGPALAYSIPSDILRVIAVERNTTGYDPNLAPRINSREQIDWVLEGRLILCYEEAIYCRGIRRVEEEGIFSPLFDHALAAKLSFMTAIALTSSAEIQSNMLNLYSGFISEAKSRDGLQGRSKRVRNRTLLKSR